MDTQNALSEKEALLARIKRQKMLLLQEMKQRQHRNAMLEERRKTVLASAGKACVLFLVTRPSIWGTYETVFRALTEDPRFQIHIVAIPNKKQLPGLYFDHEEYVDEGAYAFFKGYPCRVHNGYNPATGKWLDLRPLKPDYVFFQTPYNVCKPPQYKSWEISSYARTVFSHYAMEMIGGEVADSIFPPDFIRDMDLVFCQTRGYVEKVRSLSALFPPFAQPKAVLSGEARFDTLPHLAGCESPLWKFPRSAGKLRVIWTPRWCLSENNSHFLDYKEKVLELCDADPEIDFVFRPHPQTFLEMVGQGHMAESDVARYKREYTIRPNATLDERGVYQDTFASSDVLLTDTSSIINEYLMTGKPVIYCHKTDWFTADSAALARGFYWARTWEEVREHISALRRGEDPLAATRAEIIGQNFFIPPEGSGRYIKNFLARDFFGTE